MANYGRIQSQFFGKGQIKGRKALTKLNTNWKPEQNQEVNLDPYPRPRPARLDPALVRVLKGSLILL